MGNDSKKAVRLTEDELGQVSGGVASQAGASSKYYCVEGYSKKYNGNVKMYVSTYEDAVKLCEKLGMSTSCIKEVKGTH